jgi:hypothetical protein
MNVPSGRRSRRVNILAPPAQSATWPTLRQVVRFVEKSVGEADIAKSGEYFMPTAESISFSNGDMFLRMCNRSRTLVRTGDKHDD